MIDLASKLIGFTLSTSKSYGTLKDFPSKMLHLLLNTDFAYEVFLTTSKAESYDTSERFASDTLHLSLKTGLRFSFGDVTPFVKHLLCIRCVSYKRKNWVKWWRRITISRLLAIDFMLLYRDVVTCRTPSTRSERLKEVNSKNGWNNHQLSKPVVLKECFWKNRLKTL